MIMPRTATKASAQNGVGSGKSILIVFLSVEFRAKKLLLSLMLVPIIVPGIITAIAMY